MSRGVRIKPEQRHSGGTTDIDSLSAFTMLGVSFSVVGFDTAARRFGRFGPDGFGFVIPADHDMSAYTISRNGHGDTKYDRFSGLCADFSMTAWEDDEAVFMVMMILANGDDLTTAALTSLDTFGMYNTSGTPAAAIAAADKVCFIGAKDLDVATTYEIRAESNEVKSACALTGSMILG